MHIFEELGHALQKAGIPMIEIPTYTYFCNILNLCLWECVRACMISSIKIIYKGSNIDLDYMNF